jgi:hypothetical protein
MVNPEVRPAAALRAAACLALLCLLAACGGSHAIRHAHYSPQRWYPPPGPPGDPWGPYVHEAAGRFGLPETWIRSVMRRESGGREDAVSPAGAIGLMQVMPDTYDGLRARYGLGSDPFDPHNNILAGSAYLREMYDRFGAPGFLAAYNAGPRRLDAYLSGGTPLPTETVNYLTALAPQLGPGTPLSGPLAVYAGGGALPVRVASGGCDPDAAYDPTRPCAPVRAVPTWTPVRPSPPVEVASAACDPDVAYDPTRPCPPIRSEPVWTPTAPPPARVLQASAGCDPDAAYDPSRPCAPATFTPAVAAQPLPPPDRGFAQPVHATVTPAAFDSGQWAIQVGAFANPSTAQSATAAARALLPDMLRDARTELPTTAPLGGQVAYRARLSGLSPTAAALACARLSQRGLPCMTVPPASSF